MGTPSAVTPTGIADTNEWDCVFALPYPKANLGITQSWSSVPSTITSIALDEEGFTLAGEFGPWQIAPGGSGDLVQLSCPFLSGTLTTMSGNSYPLVPTSGLATAVVIQVRMEWIPNSNQKAFAISSSAVPEIVAALNSGIMPPALSQEFASNNISLSGAEQIVQRTTSVDWGLVDANQNSYFVFFTTDKSNNQYLDVYQSSAAWQNQLMILGNAASADKPAVILQQIINNPVPTSDPITSAVLPQMLSKWFNANIVNFSYVFASVDLITKIDTANNFAWISPSDTGYAVIDTNVAQDSIFGILSMVEGHNPPMAMQVSLNAIPAGADAGFLISGPQFVANMLLPAACSIFNNAPASSFSITNDRLSVSNANPVVWGNFTLSDSPLFTVNEDFTAGLNSGSIPAALAQEFMLNGYPLQANASLSGSNNSWLLTNGSDQYALSQTSPSTAPLQIFTSTQLTVPTNGFSLTLNNSYLEIAFQGIEYPYNDDYNVTLSYTDQFSLSLFSSNGANNVMTCTSENPNVSVTVEKTTLEVVEEIVLGALTAALGLLAIVGPVAEGLVSGARGGASIAADGSSGAIELGASVLKDGEAADPDAAAQAERDAGSAAANSAKGGSWSSIKAAFKLPRWKLIGALAGISGLVTGGEQVWDAIDQVCINDDFSSVPSFDTFATKLVAPYALPAISGFRTVSAQLNGSLQIGYTITEIASIAARS